LALKEDFAKSVVIIPYPRGAKQKLPNSIEPISFLRKLNGSRSQSRHVLKGQKNYFVSLTNECVLSCQGKETARADLGRQVAVQLESRRLRL
jgi:hypothetical protein